MNWPLPANNQLFDLEVLRARLEIRDFFLKDLYREVYENIGQLLSLVRVMLAQPGDRVAPASELVGRSIRELRAMCRSFYPDNDILKENGFGQALAKIIAITHPGADTACMEISIADDVEPGMKLIVFSMLLEVLIKIREISTRPGSVAVTFTRYKLDLYISYRGEPIALDQSAAKQYSIDAISLEQKASLINGQFEVFMDAGGITHLKLLL